MVEFNPFTLKGKTILVVGASSGIGREIAIECSKMGGKMVVSARGEEKLKSALDEMDGDENTYITADITNLDDLEKFSYLCRYWWNFCSSICNTREI